MNGIGDREKYNARLCCPSTTFTHDGEISSSISTILVMAVMTSHPATA